MSVNDTLIPILLASKPATMQKLEHYQSLLFVVQKSLSVRD